jgi:hypothetical protein
VRSRAPRLRAGTELGSLAISLNLGAKVMAVS